MTDNKRNKRNKRRIADKTIQKPSTKRGGVRPGAGRKPGSGRGLVSKIQVCVTPQQKVFYEKLGSAEWLRTYLDNEQALSELENKAVVDTDLPVQEPETNQEVQSAVADNSDELSQISPDIDFNEYLVADRAKTDLIVSQDDDMRMAGIIKGDILIVDRTAAPKDGNLVLILRKDVYSARRMKCVKSHRIQLSTERGKGKDRVLELGKSKGFTVVGVIVGVVRKTR